MEHNLSVQSVEFDRIITLIHIFNLVIIKLELYDDVVVVMCQCVCVWAFMHCAFAFTIKWFNSIKLNGLCSHFQCMFLNWLVTPTRLQNLFSLLNYSIDCKLIRPQYAFGQYLKYLHYGSVYRVVHIRAQFTVSRVHMRYTTLQSAVIFPPRVINSNHIIQFIIS